MATNLNRLCLGCMNLLPQQGAICPVCGWPTAVDGNMEHLPPGTRLKIGSKDYLLGKALGQGGFGIVYIAWDVINECKVAIKELFPNSIVKRNSSYGVAVKTFPDQNIYKTFLKNFRKEYNNMKNLNGDPNTVNVLDYIEANGTAYIVMEFIQGKTLSEVINNVGGHMSLESVLANISPVIDVLERIHNKGLIHRDISPDNIMYPQRESINMVKLMDFGAARDWDPTNPTTVAIMKEGYAPPEQYLACFLVLTDKK